MSNISRFLLLLFVIAIATCAVKSPPSTSKNWQSITLDDDLSLFKKSNGTADYFVEENTLIGVSTPNSPNTFLCTKKLYDDFILEFEVWADPALNSGVQFRSNSFTDFKNGRVHGYQVEIESSDRKWAGGIYDEGRRGWLYSLDNNEKAMGAFKVNEWNHYRIEAIGNELKTWVNNTQCTHLIDNVTAEGFIAFQVHSIHNDSLANKKIKWRNIRIKTSDLEQEKWPTSKEIPVINLIDNKL